MRRAVITGIGAVTPLGIGAGAFWEALALGRSGVRRLPGAHVGALKERKRLSVMSRSFQFAVAAAKLALEDAALTPDQLDPTRLGSVLATGTVSNDPVEFARGGYLSVRGVGDIDMRKFGQEGLSLVPPMFMLSYIPNMVGCHVSVLNNAQGPSNTITATDAAGTMALGEALRYIRSGRADAVLVGGADTRLTLIGSVRQELMHPLSRRNHAPAQACRPFDKDRDGIVLGEGGVLFVLEELKHARRRGARIYAELMAVAAAFDKSVDRRVGRWPRGSPRQRYEPYPRRGAEHGLTRAIRTAFAQADVTPRDLDHINAHGLSTIPDDIWEAEGIAAALGGAAVPVLAAKSYVGHLSAGGGPVEIAASLLALHHGVLPASLNCDHPDPACPVKVSCEPRTVTKRVFLKISTTELGQCVAVVCKVL
jgi:3-oxoacyl-[acyl-carrier-protein] synthase II